MAHLFCADQLMQRSARALRTRDNQSSTTEQSRCNLGKRDGRIEFIEANGSTRDCAVIRKCWIWAAARLGMPACGTTTPFGSPVEPEV